MSINWMVSSNTHSQRGRWEQGRSPVGGDCHHTILNLIFKIRFRFSFMPNVGAMAIAPYGLKKLHHSILSPFGFDGVVGDYTLRFYFMPISFNGALENSTLQDSKCY